MLRQMRGAQSVRLSGSAVSKGAPRCALPADTSRVRSARVTRPGTVTSDKAARRLIGVLRLFGDQPREFAWPPAGGRPRWSSQ